MKNPDKEIILILNNIRSNENVGSIFRTADAAGVSKIILCGYTPAPTDRFGRENKGLVKASLGAEKFVGWEKFENLSEAIQETAKFFSEYSQKCTDIFLLKNSSCPARHDGASGGSAQSASQGISGNTHSKNFAVVAVEQDKNSIDYKKIKQKLAPKVSHLALIFGNEVDGLSKDDLKLCDFVAEIPMRGRKESLNVSVAAGIILFGVI